MKLQSVQVLAVAVSVACVSSARADRSPEEVQAAHQCDKEVAASDQDRWKWLDAALKSNGLSPQCKAEFDKRKQGCLNDPRLALNLRERSLQSSDADHYCNQVAFGSISGDVANDEMKKKQAAQDAKEAEERKAKEAAEVATVEVPKAEMHDAKLEKMVADAYRRAYSGKVLKVILFSWSDDLEKDAFGRVTGRDLDATVVNEQTDGKCQLHGELWMQHGNGRSFSGPLSARGSGSATDREILCAKAEATASASAARAGGRKKK